MINVLTATTAATRAAPSAITIQSSIEEPRFGKWYIETIPAHGGEDAGGRDGAG